MTNHLNVFNCCCRGLTDTFLGSGCMAALEAEKFLADLESDAVETPAQANGN